MHKIVNGVVGQIASGHNVRDRRAAEFGSAAALGHVDFDEVAVFACELGEGV